MEEMKCDSMFFCKCPNILFDMLFGTFQIVIIEIKSDKDISFVEFLYNPDCMTSESEGAINHDILLCRAQIETIDVLMEEYWDMSKTFFVQIVKK